MGTLPDSQCCYIIATITGQTRESQVRGERQTLIWCLIMDVKEVHSTGSSCIPSIEILFEVCVLPSKLKKNIFLDWDFFNHLAPCRYAIWNKWIVLHFELYACMTYNSYLFLYEIVCSLRYPNQVKWITYIPISNLCTCIGFFCTVYTFYILFAVLIFSVKRYIPHALVYKFLLDLLSREWFWYIRLFHKNLIMLCERSQVIEENIECPANIQLQSSSLQLMKPE